MTKPTRAQIQITSEVVRWYFDTHRGLSSDFGLASTFMDRSRVGDFAITEDEYARGDGAALFRMLVACTMFQRLRDQLVLKILGSMAPASAREIGDSASLLRLSALHSCPSLKTTQALRECCDLAKNSDGAGYCSKRPRLRCHLKAHTVALKRYGHFGKMPTSIALALQEHGARDVAGLLDVVVRDTGSKRARSLALESALSTAWRVNQKVASMFLSLVANPDIANGRRAPWTEHVDWSYFVVIDSNVDLYLDSIGYQGTGTYDARRGFVTNLASEIDLHRFDPSVQSFNPRLVQQALYLFMSKSNRKAAQGDCTAERPSRCAKCPRALSSRCPVSHVEVPLKGGTYSR